MTTNHFAGKLFLLTGLASVSLLGQIYQADGFTATPSGWTVNGPASFNNPGGYRTTGSTPSSVISTATIPNFAPNADVTTYLNLTPGNDTGTYVLFVRASNNAIYGTGATGTYLALVIQANATAGACSTTFTLVKKGSAGLQNLWSTAVDCFGDNHVMVPEIVSRDGWIYIYNWSRHLLSYYDSENLIGKPGFGGWGMGASSGFTYGYLQPIEYGVPLPMSPSDIAVSASPSQVDFQFAGTTDAPGGRGMAFYELWRAPYGTTSFIKQGEVVITFGQFSDKSVAAGTAYTYSIDCYDFHGNRSVVQFNATTPPSGTVEPRRNGLPPTAATWGALGANVDLLSGNVNFNLPLLKAQARGGWGVTFSLNHDTQTWKLENGTKWKYGTDKGFGWGWKLFAGSIVRYYSSTGVTSHVVFTDSTGRSTSWIERSILTVRLQPVIRVTGHRLRRTSTGFSTKTGRRTR